MEQSQWFIQERAVYDANVSDWLAQHKNHYVIIKGQQILGFERSYSDALRTGLDHGKIGDFMVQRVQSPRTVEWVSHIAHAD